MNVASLQFLGFALGAALLFRLSEAPWWRSGTFLCVNLAFLFSFSRDPRSWVPLACFLAAGYVGVRLVQTRAAGRSLFWLMISSTLIAFFWLKKYSFIPNSIFLSMPYVTIGLSYMFFRLAHLIIDSYGRDISAPIGPLTYFNYLTNFTTLVSGPIQRFQDFAKWSVSPASLTWWLAGTAMERVVIGFFKVVIVSALLFHLHQDALAAFTVAVGSPARIIEVCVLGGAYSLYLYFNFSGYCDIVIGIAALFGLTLPENFNRPFSANNFLDFWRRWHMTLSNWLRYYVYNPLLQQLMETFPEPSRAPVLAIIAIFVTFFLIGFWHGQTGVFAIYGLLLGLGVSGNLLYQQAMTSVMGRQKYRALSANFFYQMAARGLTFAWFTLSLFCFWADWSQLRAICSSLGWSDAVGAFAVLAIAAAVAFTVLETTGLLITLPWTWTRPVLLSRYARTVYATTLATLVIGTILLLTQSAPTIVYEKF
jgi:alginate O-acetyltransferase complex protein AlgI